MPISDSAVLRRIALLLEIIVLSALILATRCANYRDVFVAGNIYFTDADCYARMTRVRICAEHPVTIVRHHDFENFPQGTSPHTTAPLDYLILTLAPLLRLFTAQPVDLAGALISPLLALATGWFLWCWWQRMKPRYRWTALLIFALSPILVHGTELGRPDHQSLILFFATAGICAEWSLIITPSRNWSLTSGVAWGMAIWVSFYEPIILLFVIAGFYAICDREQFTDRSRRIGWSALAVVVVIAFLVERRLPQFPIFAHDSIFRNWSRTIGELMPIHVTDPIWFRWCGWTLIVTPFLLWFATRKRFVGATSRRVLPFLGILLIACYLLTLWQARWAYFFLIVFTIALPELFESFKYQAWAWIVFAISLFPIFEDWDARLWPNEAELMRRAQARREEVEWRALARQIGGASFQLANLNRQVENLPPSQPFLAPWWLSPAIAYWSEQPGVAGSSHESLPGIADSARFYLTSDKQMAQDILRRRRIAWVFVYDSDRVLHNSAAILNASIPTDALGQILDRSPSRAPNFIHLKSQSGSGKLYSVNQFP
jgi:hypothetical protein